MKRTIALLLLACCAGALGAQSEEADAKKILQQPEYRGYRVEPSRSRSGWGDGDESDRARQGDADGDNRSEGGYRRGSRAGRPRGREGGGDSPDSGSAPDLSGLGWIGSLFEVVIWIVVIVAAAAGLFFLVKAILGIKIDRNKATKRKAAKKDPAKPEEAKAPVDAPAAADALAPEFADALTLAQREYEQALAAQDWARAALVAYRIFWLRAGWQGCVENTDVRTWRDALRMVRAVDLRQRVRELLRMVERVRYGEHVPQAEEFHAWRAELDAVNPREALS